MCSDNSRKFQSVSHRDVISAGSKLLRFKKSVLISTSTEFYHRRLYLPQHLCCCVSIFHWFLLDPKKTKKKNNNVSNPSSYYSFPACPSIPRSGRGNLVWWDGFH
ncbi:hypothetical protein IV203_033543 [Nitzschia inconspicua]|uniref:Uncharacterized protein n=1 Tax=Nitzschia inconspicua TaxID=303405 RepID=A0A9K3M301_9STRA|nr:hypothetical protein IV203_023732 [Nitzschia inconspicua]KAG7372819.1 hypothetical protein IV203_033543 [Nitzschia inconspicua]